MPLPTSSASTTTMRLSISWSLGCDSDTLASTTSSCPAGWIQFAQAVEYAGLDGLFIASSAHQQDSLTVAATLCAHTRHLRLIPGLDSGLMLPAALAAVAQSLQSISQQRLCLHLADGDQGSTRRALGELLNRDQRSERIGEYLLILRQLLDARGPALDFQGRYFSLENGGHARRDLPAPPLLLDDSIGAPLIAAHADQCLVQADHPQRLAATLARLQDAARQQGRDLTFATRIGWILRDDPGQAWYAAEHWLQRQHDDENTPCSASHANVASLAAGGAASPARRFEIYPNLWRPSFRHPPFLVGDAQQLVTRLTELHELGIAHVIIESPPSVREALRVGETVLPSLRASGLMNEARHRVE